MMHFAKSLMVLLILTAMLSMSFGADFEMRTDKGMNLEITSHQAPVARMEYVGWGANWKYASTNLRVASQDGAVIRFEGQNANLKVDFAGTATADKNQLVFVYNMTPQEAMDPIVGFGQEFNLVLDSPSLGGGKKEPELLENNTGWRWEVDAGKTIEVKFNQPIAQVYFERGNKAKIRAMFATEKLDKAPVNLTMTVSLPEGGEVVKSLAEKYGPADPANWYKDALDWNQSPVDLSFLNHKPAGKHGFVQARGADLVFEDGTPVRFWGGNIAAYSIFSDKDAIQQQAKRIAQLGYNLMRIHHHDSTRWVGRTVIDKSRNDSQHFDAEVMDRLDWWIKCLRDEGVYVWLDLHVGREFKDGDNITPGWDEISKNAQGPVKAAEGKGYSYFNESIEDLMKKFNEQYLSHVNPYTQLAYKDDPAVMGLLITNENDLTNHFGNLMLADKGNPVHNAIFMQDVNAFAAKHKLNPGQTAQTWVDGPSKIYLSNREYQWNQRMLSHLEKLGVKMPIATTHMWGGMKMSGLPPLLAGSIVDVHSYGRSEALSANPRYNDNYISYMATGQAVDKPVAITEWNVPYPEQDRFTCPLYVASISALQGWDAPMIYNYSQRPMESQSRPDTWSTFIDPAITGMMPAAAILYREGHVSPGEKTYVLKLDRENTYLAGRHPNNMAALRTLVEQSRIFIGLPDTPELDWDAESKIPAGAIVVDDLDKDFIPENQDFVKSDSGELMRNWVEGYQVIDTPKSQAAQGWIGGRQIDLKASSMKISTSKAAVAFSSLDGQPIGQSRKVLISLMARVVSPNGQMPLHSEPVKGEIRVGGPQGLKVYPLGKDGAKGAAVATDYSNGRYVLQLPAPQGTHWYLLAE